MMFLRKMKEVQDILSSMFCDCLDTCLISFVLMMMTLSDVILVVDYYVMDPQWAAMTFLLTFIIILLVYHFAATYFHNPSFTRCAWKSPHNYYYKFVS